MTHPTIAIIDKDLPLNEGFYERLVNTMATSGTPISYHREAGQAPADAPLLLATPCDLAGISGDRVVLGLRTINRKERMQVAGQVLPEHLIARWASPADDRQLAELLPGWGGNCCVFKYDWSAGRKGVTLLQPSDLLPADYHPDKDLVMEYLDEDPYTYKADLCGGVLLNSWFLRTVPISAASFHEYTIDPAQYQLPAETTRQLEQLSVELLRYGSGYISVDLMKYRGAFKIIEINTNSVGRNISWEHFGDTYLDTYPQGLRRLMAALPGLPTLQELWSLGERPVKLLPPSPART